MPLSVADRVAMIGAGPVGMFTACALGRVGVPVTVYESSQTLDWAPRAIGYSQPIHADLDGWGVLDGMRQKARMDSDGVTLHLTTLDEKIHLGADPKDPTSASLALGQGDGYRWGG